MVVVVAGLAVDSVFAAVFVAGTGDAVVVSVTVVAALAAVVFVVAVVVVAVGFVKVVAAHAAWPAH